MRITELRSVKIGVERLDDEGKYRLTIQDPHTREVVWVGFGQDVADAIMEQLTGGIRVVSRLPSQ